MKINILLSFFFILLTAPVLAEEVSIDVHTDDWGYEVYWELTASWNDCGQDPIFTGGNPSVGCNGGGDQQQPSGGYPNNSTISEGPWDLNIGDTYKIIFVDDWGDGGATFDVKIGGYVVYTFQATGSNDAFIFEVVELPQLEVSVHELTVGPYVVQGTNEVTGHIFNGGLETITSLTLAYWVDGGEWVTGSLNDLQIEPFEEYSFVHPIAWGAWAAGEYDLTVMILEVNGVSEDDNPDNNFSNSDITVISDQPNILPSYFLDAENVTTDVIGDIGDQVNTPRDLDFHPGGDLWLVNQGTENSGGSTVKFTDPGTDDQTSLWQQDGNAWHFMSLPSGIAFSLNTNFATSTSVFDANHNGGEPFTGPALWSSDPDIYAQPSGGNGSHMDMLHESPYCMGIAWEKDNVFWVFDHYNGDIVRYDFAEDHGPGNSDHTDGMIRRYPEVEVSWIDQDISCHVEFDEDKEYLYIVDGGSSRVLRLNSTTGEPSGAPSWGPHEPLAEYTNMSGVEWDVVVDAGLIEPSGIEVLDSYMVVTDHANGDVVFFDISQLPATEIGRVETGSPGIQGITIGPEGYLWYVNSTTNEVVKLLPGSIVLNNAELPQAEWKVYPNPASDRIQVELTDVRFGEQISIYSVSGALVYNQSLNGTSLATIDVADLPRGVYILEVNGAANNRQQRIILR